MKITPVKHTYGQSNQNAKHRQLVRQLRPRSKASEDKSVSDENSDTLSLLLDGKSILV
jgi:hypothetical protein